VKTYPLRIEVRKKTKNLAFCTKGNAFFRDCKKVGKATIIIVKKADVKNKSKKFNHIPAKKILE
jgi:hypothetical protein